VGPSKDSATGIDTAGPPASLPDPVVVIGAGPAGLTAAYELVMSGDPVIVVEADSVVEVSVEQLNGMGGDSISVVTVSSPR